MISMKEYYSDVILEDDKDRCVKCCNCDKVFPTVDILLNIKDEEDEDHEEYCPFCNTKSCLMDLGTVNDLWNEFGDIPMNPETEKLEENWNGFGIGTYREEIWRWFEETFHIRVYDLMYGKNK